MEAVDYVRKVWLPARGLVAEAIKGRAAVDAGGRIIVLPKVGEPTCSGVGAAAVEPGYIVHVFALRLGCMREC